MALLLKSNTFLIEWEVHMKLLLSSHSLEPFPLEEVFLLGREVGADGLELVLMPSVYKLGFAKVKELSQKYGLPIVNIHQPPWYVLFTGRRGVNKFLKIAQYFGAQNVVMHLATARRRSLSDFWSWIKTRERETGLSIAFENAAPRFLERWPRYAGVPEALENFIESQKVNLTLDVAKAVLTGTDPYQFFQKHTEQIKVLHFHGFNQGSFHVGFRGHNFDWSGFMSFVKKFNFDGAVTLEIFPFHKWLYFRRPAKEQLARAREIIKESFTLLKRA